MRLSVQCLVIVGILAAVGLAMKDEKSGPSSFRGRMAAAKEKWEQRQRKTSNGNAQNPKDGSYQVQFLPNLTFTTFDNLTLLGDAFIPVRPAGSTETFPVVIFPNSWAMPQIEYILKVLQLGERGYVAVEYETRGWYRSQGEIDVCGPKDLKDGSSVLDFVLSPSIVSAWNVDVTKVAFAGISYGAGISLSMAGFDSRVTTSLVLSGWNNLTDALYNYNTPNLAWGELLVIAADILGRPSKNIQLLFDDILRHKNLSYIEAYAAERSPGRFLDVINSRNVPLFISSNFIDRLFRPQHMLHFFEKLTVPKFLLLNQGMHAEPEALGLFDIPHNYIWDKANRWLDYWLKGAQNGIMDLPTVHMERGGSIFDKTYVTFDTWPPTPNAPNTSHRSDSVLFMTPRNDNQYGGLSTSAPNPNTTGTVDDIAFSLLPSIGEGIPFVADALSSVGVAHTDDLSLSNTQYSLVYLSDPLAQDTSICGTTKLNLTLVVPVGSSWQVNGLIYEVDGLGIGSLISDLAYTNWKGGNSAEADGQPRHGLEEIPRLVRRDASDVRKLRERRAARAIERKKQNLKTTAIVQLQGIMAHSFCRKIAQGQRLAIGFVLYNNLWEPANTNGDFELGFTFIEEPAASIAFPVVDAP